MQTLAEDLLLLMLDDEKGTVPWDSMELPNGLGGALLMDLARQERIEVDEKRVVVRDPSPTGDEILDHALEMIYQSKRPRDAKHWVSKLGGQHGLKEDLARRLVERGILEEREQTYLWVFTRHRFPEVDPTREAMLREDIRDVVLSNEAPDPRTMLLLSLVHACDLTGNLFTKDERKHAKKRIKNLVESEAFGAAIGGAISDATTAIIAAITANISVSMSAANSSSSS